MPTSSDFYDDNFYYETAEKTTIVGIINRIGPFPTIPSNVTRIGDNAFTACSGLTGTVTIPSNVTRIGDNAFAACSGLTGTLSIPSSVTTISSNAFSGCSKLTSLTFADNSNLTIIGQLAFYFCTGLTGTVTIPSSVISIGSATFYECTGLTSLIFANNSSLVSIGSNAFQKCSKLTSLTFADNSKLTSIETSAFENCTSLAGTLIIPLSVTFIGNSAFKNCNNLTNINYYAVLTNNIGFGAFPNNAIITVLPWFVINSNIIIGFLPAKKTGVSLSLPTIPSTVRSIANNAFLSRDDLIGTVEIPVTMISIGGSAFHGCNKLSKISYFATTTIFTDVFKDCVIPTVLPWFFINSNIITGFLPAKKDKVSLLLPTIPSSVTSIANNAFKDRNDLTGTLTVPSNVTNIGDSAFSGCTKLSKISYFTTTTIGTDAFKGCKPPTVLPLFLINSNIITGFLPAKKDKVSLPLPTIPLNVTSIANNAFLNRDDLTGTLIIPSTVTSIGTSAFSGCTKLSKISYFATTTIGTDAFKGCKPPTVLPWFVINNNNEITGFKPDKKDKVSLKLPTIPLNVTSIANNAFLNRDDITGTLIIPSTVTSIGTSAFSGCTKLSKISYFATTTIGTDAFKGCKPPTVLPWFVITNNRITSFLPAKRDKVSLSLPIIPSTVTSIGAEAFKDRNDITGTLAIPVTVTSIGTSAFNGCTKLSKISYFTGTTIGTDAFKGCKTPTISIPKKMIKVNSFKIGFYRGKLIM
jgi:hypothetical protein